MSIEVGVGSESLYLFSLPGALSICRQSLLRCADLPLRGLQPIGRPRRAVCPAITTWQIQHPPCATSASSTTPPVWSSSDA